MFGHRGSGGLVSQLGSERGQRRQRANQPGNSRFPATAEPRDFKTDLQRRSSLHAEVPDSRSVRRHGRGGKLKITGGFGVSDQEQNSVVQPQSRFRIASVSKPVTSVAVMKLVETGKLQLSDFVFGSNGILNRFQTDQRQLKQSELKRIRRIRVRHLLEHTCGGWGNRQKDPMFAGAAIDFDHDGLIRWTLQNRPLEQDPGKSYAYSNFGYCLLGRIIESKTGQSYQDAVQALVLKPAGITSMQIGGDTLDDRAQQEVNYYGQQEDPYHRVMRVSRMDAHGGWIATAADLVRLVVHVDNFEQPADLLAPATIKTMTTGSTANRSYAKGWSVNRSDNWWHQGSFNGGTAIMARIHDQFAWAVLVNTRPKTNGYGAALDALPWQIRRAVKRWPDHDLFANG
jgi:CubicO group peptidase (beta-lactamase class C family)